MPRKSSFKPEYVEQVVKLCRLGAKNEELASFFGVSGTTIDNWIVREPLFIGAIKEGKITSDSDVTSSLYRRATGYEWDEEVPTKIKEVIYENGKKVKEVEKVIVTVVHKVLPPETTAAIFWLKNRRRDEWRDRQEVTGADGGPMETSTTVTFIPKQLPDGYWKSEETQNG